MEGNARYSVASRSGEGGGFGPQDLPAQPYGSEARLARLFHFCIGAAPCGPTSTQAVMGSSEAWSWVGRAI